jgi:Tfp pilus assembly protein PilN
MIQFNLLPDIKLEYLKAERTRRLFLAISIGVTLVAILILVILLSVTGLQKKHLSDLKKDNATDSSTIQNKTDINKILTVQNQLESLTNLHNMKPAASRLSNYLNEVTPASATISDLTVDFTQDTITVDGTADSLTTVNQYIDTLKFTTYTSSTNSSASNAFSAVVLSSFGVAKGSVTYSLTMTYDPAIFDITQTINLTVPKQVTTRSEVDQPTDLFKASTGTGQ